MNGGELCYSCFDHTTFQLFGQTTDGSFQREMIRYVEALKEDEVIECFLCDRKVKYVKDNGKWREVLL